MQVTDDRIAETTTSTGTGDLVLSGALTAHRTFASMVADGNIVTVSIEAVDSQGNPTGDWETATAKYNAGANSITRTAVSRSSNSDALVNFPAGTKRIYLTLIADQLYQDNGVPFRKLERLSSGINANILWNFYNSLEGWSSSNTAGATVTFDANNGRGLLLEDISTTLQPSLNSPASLAINGNLYRRVKVSVTLVDAPSGFDSSVAISLRYITSGHAASSSFVKVVNWPHSFNVSDTIILDFDMANLTAGGNDWYTNIITRLSFNSVTSISMSGIKLRFNWIAVCENEPPLGNQKKMLIRGL